MPGPWIKVCGLLSIEQAEQVAFAGVDAIGLNFVSWSQRRIERGPARELARALSGKAERIGVVSDVDASAILTLMREVGLDRVQLHDCASPELLLALGSAAFPAIGVSGVQDVQRARECASEWVLVDASHGGQSGGTGRVFDWQLLGDLCLERRVLLAGGLHPGNVADAVRRVCPYGVDTASGVEFAGRPGDKDLTLVTAFVAQARAAAAAELPPCDAV